MGGTRNGWFSRGGLPIARGCVCALVAGLIGVLSFGSAGCDRSPRPAPTPLPAVKNAPREPGPLRIVVTVPPLAGLVREVVPEGSEVTILMPPGRSEHGYEFTAGDVAKLGKADVVVYVGLGLEPRVAEFVENHPSGRRVDVCVARALNLEGPDAVVEEHDHAEDDGHDHDHGPVDQHVWLDPVLMKKLVPALAGAVFNARLGAGEKLDPAAMPSTAALEARIDAVDREYRERLAPLAGKAIVTHHNAWSRLAERYGIKVAAVIRPIESVEPSPGQIAKCIDAIRGQSVSTIFVEPQFNNEAAERLAKAANVKVGVLDPLGNGDWFAMMESNLAALEAGLK